MAKTGRPSKYSPELAENLCAMLGDGNSLRKCCAMPEFPSTTTIMRWLNENETFRLQYARAKQESADSRADQVEEIAEKLLSGEIEDPQRARVAADLYKWAAGKEKPKKYGDKLQTENTNENKNLNVNADIDSMSEDELNEFIEKMRS